jgi:hypothetical protein
MNADYDTTVACWRLLAEAVTDLRLMKADESWLEEALAKLLLLTDQLKRGDIAGDEGLTGPARLIADLEGWSVCGSLGRYDDRLPVRCPLDPSAFPEDQDDSHRFYSADKALEFIRARARTGEPGTKLHRVALSLVDRN